MRLRAQTVAARIYQNEMVFCFQCLDVAPLEPGFAAVREAVLKDERRSMTGREAWEVAGLPEAQLDEQDW